MNLVNPSAELHRMINGYRVTQAIYVAATLGLSDRLAGGPRTIDDLAQATGSDRDALHRLMRALVSVGVYAQLADGQYTTTPIGDLLRSDVEGSLHGWAVFIGRPYHWQAWSALDHSVRTGQSAFSVVFGQSVWDYRQDHPDEGEIFDAAMTAISRHTQTAVLDAYDFGVFETVADVCGGRGALLAALLGRHSRLHGVLFDLPHVVEGAPKLLRGAGVEDRCRVVGGDVFAGVPAADALLLKQIIHDWDDERATAILRRCREAMRADSVLLIIERVVTDPPDTQIALTDLNMLVGPGGRERTGLEYAALLDRADLELTRIIPTAGDVSLVEARPAPGS
jgi:hypothetical protein